MEKLDKIFKTLTLKLRGSKCNTIMVLPLFIIIVNFLIFLLINKIVAVFIICYIPFVLFFWLLLDEYDLFDYNIIKNVFMYLLFPYMILALFVSLFFKIEQMYLTDIEIKYFKLKRIKRKCQINKMKFWKK